MRRIGLVNLAAGIVFLLLETQAFGFGVRSLRQDKKESSAVSRFQVYSNQAYGFKVAYRGIMTGGNNGGWTINLASPAGPGSDAGKVRIFVAQRPFVDLPGTYGGRYYFAAGAGANVMSDRVRGDSVNVNGLEFARDYWAVYAGMGQWETVINCYALHGGRCYIVSLEHDFVTPKPGEVINGSVITKTQIRTMLVSSLHDTTNGYVRSFNEILGSFSLTR